MPPSPFVNRPARFELPSGWRPFVTLGPVVLGAMVGLAFGFLAGGRHERTTTVIASSPATVSPAGSSAGSWRAVYAQAAGGTVDITVQSTSIALAHCGAPG